MRFPSAATLVAFVLLTVVAALGGDRAASASPASEIVASVTDGDTLRLVSGERVRLLQIDSSELGSGECYSRAARSALLARVPLGSRVELEADPRLDRIDRLGRFSDTFAGAR